MPDDFDINVNISFRDKDGFNPKPLNGERIVLQRQEQAALKGKRSTAIGHDQRHNPTFNPSQDMEWFKDIWIKRQLEEIDHGLKDSKASMDSLITIIIGAMKASTTPKKPSEEIAIVEEENTEEENKKEITAGHLRTLKAFYTSLLKLANKVVGLKNTMKLHEKPFPVEDEVRALQNQALLYGETEAFFYLNRVASYLENLSFQYRITLDSRALDYCLKEFIVEDAEESKNYQKQILHSTRYLVAKFPHLLSVKNAYSHPLLIAINNRDDALFADILAKWPQRETLLKRETLFARAAHQGSLAMMKRLYELKPSSLASPITVEKKVEAAKKAETKKEEHLLYSLPQLIILSKHEVKAKLVWFFAAEEAEKKALLSNPPKPAKVELSSSKLTHKMTLTNFCEKFYQGADKQEVINLIASYEKEKGIKHLSSNASMIRGIHTLALTTAIPFGVFMGLGMTIIPTVSFIAPIVTASVLSALFADLIMSYKKDSTTIPYLGLLLSCVPLYFAVGVGLQLIGLPAALLTACIIAVAAPAASLISHGIISLAGMSAWGEKIIYKGTTPEVKTHVQNTEKVSAPNELQNKIEKAVDPSLTTQQEGPKLNKVNINDNVKKPHSYTAEAERLRQERKDKYVPGKAPAGVTLAK